MSATSNKITQKFPVQFPSKCEELYEPIKPLGKGGFGSVWLARPKNQDTAYAYTALKVIGSTGNTRKLTNAEIGYARRETAVLFELSHANIVKLFCVISEGSTATDSTLIDTTVTSTMDGSDATADKEPVNVKSVVDILSALRADSLHKCCLSLSYHAGPTLGKLLKHGGALGLPMAKDMARQILDAVGYIHTRGVIHRDIKPDNIIVTGADLNSETCWSDGVDADDCVRQHKWHVTLIDFGFARPLHPDDVNVDVGLYHVSNNIDNTGDKTNDMVFMSVNDPIVVNKPDEASTVKCLTRSQSVSRHRIEDLSALGNRFYAAPEILSGVHKFVRRLSTSRERRNSTLNNSNQRSENNCPKNGGNQETHSSTSVSQRQNSAARISNSQSGSSKLRTRRGSDVTGGNRRARFFAKKNKNTPLAEFVSAYGMVADAYSVGATLRYILTGVPPNESVQDFIAQQTNPIVIMGKQIGRLFQSRTSKEKKQVTKRKNKYRYHNDLPSHVQKLILGLTHWDPQKRLSVRAASQSTWFDDAPLSASVDIKCHHGLDKIYKHEIRFLSCAMEGMV